MKPQRPPPTSPGRGPHFPDPRDLPATGKGGSATAGPIIPPDPPLPRNGSTRGRAKGPAINAGPTAKQMTAGVLSNTMIHQIRALALGERRQPAICTETGARAAHMALVHEIFSTLRSTHVRRVRNPQNNEPHSATGPAAAAHSHTLATRVPRRPCAREETTRRLRGRLLPTGGPADGRRANDFALGHKPRRPRASQPRPKGPLVQPSGARPRNTPQQHLSVGPTNGNDINLPDT